MRIIDAVRRIAPNAKPNYVAAIESGDQLFSAFEVTNTLRQCHFLAQELHETGGFTILRENMNYSAERLVEVFGVGQHSAAITAEEAARISHKPELIADRVYGLGNPHKAVELGNTLPGHGYFFRGGGGLQTTGGKNYRRMGDKCGVDFYANPDLIWAAEHALKPALHEWAESNLNVEADKNNLHRITRVINGGYNGEKSRQAWFDKLWPLLSGPRASNPVPAWTIAQPDHSTAWLQEALNKLGARPALVVDGKSGPATRNALIAFQQAARLTPDGIAGPVTIAMIELRLGVTKAA